MAEAIVQDLSENLLQCSICLEYYNDPRVLPCLHSFCLPCLKSLEGSRKFQPLNCPSCRRNVHLPAAGVSGLQKNFLLVDLMERLKLDQGVNKNDSDKSRCNMCQGTQEVFLCLQCNLHICSNCKSTHDLISNTSYHELLPVGNHAIKQKKITQARRCHKHRKEKLRLFCLTCQQVVCKRCVTEKHSRHTCVAAEVKAAQVRRELETLVEDYNKESMFTQYMMSQENMMMKKVEDRLLLLNEEVDHLYENFIRRLSYDKELLKKDLEKQRKEISNLCKKQHLEARLLTEALSSLSVEGKKIVEENNTWQILEAEKEFLDRFRELKRQQMALCETLKELELGIFAPVDLLVLKRTELRVSSEQKSTVTTGGEISLPKENLLGSIEKRQMCAIL